MADNEDRRPRVVEPREPIPGPGNPVFDYFALKGTERLPLVNDRIKEIEKTHLELTMMRIGLEGNPVSPIPHVTNKVGPNAVEISCMCNECELKRVSDMLATTEYKLRELRALYARMAN